MYPKRTYIILLFVMLLGLFSIKDSGVMWDEELHAAAPNFTRQFLENATPLPFDLKYYGPFVDITSLLLFKVVRVFIEEQGEVDPERLLIRALVPGSGIIADQRFYHFKHIYVFLISCLAYLSVAILVGKLTAPKFAYLGIFALLLIPQFWGYGYFNPKDSPFASFFTLATLLGVVMITYLLSDESRASCDMKKLRLSGAAFGAIAGVTTSVRVGGFVLLLFIPLTMIVVVLANRSLWKIELFKSSFKQAAIVFISFFLVVYLSHPVAWGNPFSWFAEAVDYLSNHPFSTGLLFLGEYVPNTELPFYYIPLWLAVTIPVYIQLLFLLGTTFIVFKFRAFSVSQQSLVVMVYLQMFFLLGVAIAKNSPLDAGIRQFLFIIPAIAVISAAGLAFLLQKIKYKMGRIVLLSVVLLCSLSVARDMISIHPYQYLYFNSIVESLLSPNLNKPPHKLFETDHLGLSLREASEWINENGDRNATIYVNGPYHSALIFLGREFTLKHLAHVKEEDIKRPFYYLSLPRGRWEELYPKCERVYRVERKIRDTVLPLSVVKYCGL